MTRLILLALLLVACTPTTRRHVNRAAMGLALAATACDWGQTRATAAGGWRDHNETNVILGKEPTTRAVDLYMLGMAVAVVALGEHLPERWRAVYYGAFALSEIWFVVGNTRLKTPMPNASTCGAGSRPVYTSTSFHE